ncbi:hypothetical protein CCH79_00019202 [Gambusia affinis]|uniref:RING-type domain-containing protein n=1 Tax=Gambusia affinis TaxID=33528 RepID=A0A315UN57_GAMAF|nr:hypothetical protein CCH79_00019202 [Gambusia affinis]
MASRLEEDLCCPVCCDVYKGPVILPCSHSFCKDCLQTCWRVRAGRSCPVCRKRSATDAPPCNLALKNLCESFLQQREQKNRSSTGSGGSTGTQISAQQPHRNTGLLDRCRLSESQSRDGLQEQNHRAGETRTRTGSRTRSGSAGSHLEDGSGQVHLFERQLLVVLRRVFGKRLRSLNTETDVTMVTPSSGTASAPLPHLLLCILPLPPSPLFLPQNLPPPLPPPSSLRNLQNSETISPRDKRLRLKQEVDSGQEVVIVLCEHRTRSEHFVKQQAAGSVGFYLLLELLQDIAHGPVVVQDQTVSLSKLKVTVEVCRPLTSKLLLTVQDDGLLLQNIIISSGNDLDRSRRVRFISAPASPRSRPSSSGRARPSGLGEKVSSAAPLLYLRHVEEQRDGVVEVGVGASGVDPEMPENREESRAGEQDAGNQEDVPEDWTV